MSECPSLTKTEMSPLAGRWPVSYTVSDRVELVQEKRLDQTDYLYWRKWFQLEKLLNKSWSCSRAISCRMLLHDLSRVCQLVDYFRQLIHLWLLACCGLNVWSRRTVGKIIFLIFINIMNFMISRALVLEFISYISCSAGSQVIMKNIFDF